MTAQQSSTSTPVAPSLDMTALLEPVRADLEVVEKWLHTNLVDDSSFIMELLGQVFRAGGKRLRPALALLSAKATKPQLELPELQIILAVLTELIHTASLVHDDVLDSAAVRRGQETVNRKWNDKLAILIGDLLFAQASICLARLENPPIVGVYGQVLADLCAGEIRQMRMQFVTVVNWETYIQKSIWKTASLFAAATKSAALLNNETPEVVEAMNQYGLNLGICFQIVDDLLDVTGSTLQLGKAGGSDLVQGVVTAPAMFVLERDDEPAKRLQALIKNRGVQTPEGIEEALAIVKDGGGIEQTGDLARRYARQAKEALVHVEPSAYRDTLEALGDWLLTRTK